MKRNLSTICKLSHNAVHLTVLCLLSGCLDRDPPAAQISYKSDSQVQNQIQLSALGLKREVDGKLYSVGVSGLPIQQNQSD